MKNILKLGFIVGNSAGFVVLWSHNASSLFGVDKIPSDNHIRDILDNINPNHIEPLFEELLNTLKKRGILEKYKYLDSYLVLLDGTGYHSSKTISCEKCLTREYTKGTITYHHQAITPIIASPNSKHIIPLMPELIENSDGTDKQDCEINTSKRWLKRDISLGLPIILLGDDLYSREPFCKDTLKCGKSFIFVAKEDSRFIVSFFNKNNSSFEAVQDSLPIIMKDSEGNLISIIEMIYIRRFRILRRPYDERG